MKSRVLRSISAISLAGAVMLVAASPSLAEKPSSDATASESSSSSTGSLLFGGSSEAAVYQTEQDRLAQEKLASLSQVQTQEEVDAIVDSGKPAVLFFDKAVGQYTAGYYVEKSVESRLTFRGPGCAVGDACMLVNGVTNIGYYGTGAVSGDWRGVTRLSAGTNLTTFWYTATQGTFVAPNVTTYIAPTNFNRITRS